jgi:hypothetical protein
MNDKTQQLIDWLCGRRREFPFLQDLPIVSLPDMTPLTDREIERSERESHLHP